LSTSSGAAAHVTLESAVLNGLLEAIERDAFMISWVNRLPPPLIDPESVKDERLLKVFGDLRRYGLEWSLLLLPSDIPVYTVCCVIKDRNGAGPAVSLGADSEFKFEDAALSAITEALAVHSSVRLNREKYAREGKGLPQDPITLGRDERLLWWSTPEKINDIAFFADAGRKIGSDELPSYPNPKTAREKLDFLVKILKQKNLDVSYAEILERGRAEKLNLRVVMTVVPGLQPLHLVERFPYFWGERMSAVPKLFGYEPAKEPNRLPHPFP
jgi:ribosomal protein S12 methylthiotransferase accessory factor